MVFNVCSTSSAQSSPFFAFALGAASPTRLHIRVAMQMWDWGCGRFPDATRAALAVAAKRRNCVAARYSGISPVGSPGRPERPRASHRLS